MELFFDPESNDYVEKRMIRSFVDVALGRKEAPVFIACNMPFNIMADKFTALVWRIFDDTEKKDYTLMRHLHDLHALSKHIPINSELVEKMRVNFDTKDQFRFDGNINFLQLITLTSKKLESEHVYRESYTKFVYSMSYASDDEYVGFDEAYLTFRRIANAISKA